MSLIDWLKKALESEEQFIERERHVCISELKKHVHPLPSKSEREEIHNESKVKKFILTVNDMFNGLLNISKIHSGEIKGRPSDEVIKISKGIDFLNSCVKNDVVILNEKSKKVINVLQKYKVNLLDVRMKKENYYHDINHFIGLLHKLALIKQ